MAEEKHISIPLSHIAEDLELHIFPEGESEVFKIEEAEAIEFGEFPYQILESQSYEYAFNNNEYCLSCDNKGIVKQSHREKFSGRINPSYYVGTLKLNITHKEKELKRKHTFLEVKATKFNSDNIDKSYRENYRFMLENITEKCTELLLQVNSPIQQHFETDFDKESESLYQQFSFVNSVIGSIGFEEAIQKIISSPKTDWANNEELSDIRSVKKFTRSSVKQLISRGNRIPIPKSHPLYDKPLINIPSHIINNRKVEVIDNAENRFIKHALQTYLHFSEKCLGKFEDGTRAHKEAKYLTAKLELHLNNSFFKQVSRPTSLNFNSPVLQRKSGYREILKSWLKFDLAAKLTWTGGEDVYNAGKRDISKLYEYWLFFMLYDLFKSKFPLEEIEHDGNPYESLIKKKDKSLNFIIKSGTHTAFSGISEFDSRKLNVRFSYNQTFKGDTALSKKTKGSYTKNMYPDYTLSFWPADKTDKEAEEKELIVHIHFDAKYKVNYSGTIDDTREKEEEAERKGDYKNVDLFKMHAYKDAIRRTGGAYILYPGNSKGDVKLGFHEIIPGLGAFAIRPSLNNNGTAELSNFIDKIISHLSNRASQRENIAHKTYKIHDEELKEVREPIPEYLDVEKTKKLIPNNTNVLVGYIQEKQKKWLEDEHFYNIRLDNEIDPNIINAKFLLLYDNISDGELNLWKNGLYHIEGLPRNRKANWLTDIGYKNPSKQEYIVYKLTESLTTWSLDKISKIKNPNGIRDYIPFSVTLTDLMKIN